MLSGVSQRCSSFALTSFASGLPNPLLQMFSLVVRVIGFTAPLLAGSHYSLLVTGFALLPTHSIVRASSSRFARALR